MSHKRLDKTFSTCDILRIWDDNLTDVEQDEVVAFFSIILPALDPDHNIDDLLGSLLAGPWGPLSTIVESMARIRSAKLLRRKSYLDKMFTSPGTSQCVFDFVQKLRMRRRIT